MVGKCYDREEKNGKSYKNKEGLYSGKGKIWKGRIQLKGI